MAADGSSARKLLERSLLAAASARDGSSSFVSRVLAASGAGAVAPAVCGAAQGSGAVLAAPLSGEVAPSTGDARARSLLARAVAVAAGSSACAAAAATDSPAMVQPAAANFSTPTDAPPLHPAASPPVVFLPPVPELGGVSVYQRQMHVAASPSLLEVATAVGAVAAVRQAALPAPPSPALPSPIVPPLLSPPRLLRRLLSSLLLCPCCS